MVWDHIYRTANSTARCLSQVAVNGGKSDPEWGHFGAEGCWNVGALSQVGLDANGSVLVLVWLVWEERSDIAFLFPNEWEMLRNI